MEKADSDSQSLAPCVHELVARRALRAPRATALVKGLRAVSYGELDRLAACLAGELRSRGVRRETLVAVLVGRSPEMIVAQLAVLKAGGAYLSLDPSYPRERLAFMLEDSRAELVLTRGPVVSLCGVRSLDLDSMASALEAGVSAAPVVAVDPRQRGYVIYTSGSTGRPKGTELTHAGLAALVAWHGREYGVSPEDRATQLASPAFDASVWEIWPYLTAGAALHFPTDEVRASPPDLYRWLADRGITLTFLPTPLAEAMLEEEVPQGLALRYLLVGGDKLHRPPRPGLPFRLVNHYGPTEDTVVTTAGETSPAGAAPVQTALSIGRPIICERVHLLRGALGSAGAGKAGELTIGGSGLARGYLRRPALTAERFVPDPFDGDGERLYLTGDLARSLPDGALEFLGRLDHQVKVRGFRIELGEIEAALGEHPAVRTAVVTARPDAFGTRQLAAYVVPRRPPLPDVRQDLLRRLPEHMVPSAVVEIAELPLTANGKVDLDALPEPEWGVPAGEWIAPRTPTEKRLAGLFGQLLNRDAVDLRDHFFELGGHSLLAAQLVSRLRQAFGVELAPREVFEHPTVEELAARLDELRDGGQPTAGERLPAPPPIRPAPRDRPLPLAFPQRAVFFLDHLVPGSIAYNAQFTVSLHGALDTAVLERALSEIIRRHEVLRTTFEEVDGQPVQRIHPPWRPDLQVVDFSYLAADDRPRRAEELVWTVVQRDFDVGRLPLAKWTLVRFAADDHLLIQVEHHFVHDGWSVGVLLRELMALYEAFVEGRPSPLPGLPLQWADYAAWQHAWMEGEVLAERVTYWRQQLEDVPLVLDLPTDRPRPPEQTLRGARLDADLPADLYAALREASRRERVTLFMTMLATFQVLLYRYSGEPSFVTGFGVANRTLREIETLIGMMVNTIVLPADLTAEPTFRELLGRVRETTLGAQAHQDLPFDRLVEALAPPRDLSRNPVFQHMFSFHDSPLPDIDFGGIEGRLLERHNGSTKADWNVVFRPRAEQRVGRAASAEDELMRVMWEYSTDLFDAATVERVWGHYQVLLRAVVRLPQARVSELPLLRASEREQLLAWNRTAVELPATPGVHQLFEQRVDADPQALAAAGDGRRMSYGELETRANRLAHHLIDLGVGPEVLVGVAMAPTPDLLVALLAVLKAGGAYLPLDPTYPRERLAYTLEDSRPQVLLIDGRSRSELPEELLSRVPPRGNDISLVPLRGNGARVVAVDGELPPASGERLAPRAGSRHLAYVIYTSGSTGRPKGTELTHHGLLNLVCWHCRTYGVAPGDRAAKTASLAFDASVWEIWPYLAAGASLHFPSEAVRSSPALVYRWLGEEAIDLAFLATPFAEAMLQEPSPEGLSLRALLVGGDKLHRVPRRRLPFRLVNHYGPTESTVVSTWGEVPPPAADAANAAAPPIGRPIDNLRVRVLDRWLAPVPIGVPGELAVGGIGLARGYLGWPRLTAERFVPDPFSAEPDERLYLTGDLVRYLADGEIEFVGRIDAQVKLRGFRIELGEIESVIGEHPRVGQAAVAVREAPSGEPFLAAYYVPSTTDAGENGTELAAWLGDRLPRFMVPTSFHQLESLPLSPNGKIDRKALPETEAAPDRAAHVEPRTAVEEFLAGVWADVLSRDRIGVHDDFFQLGGHSLLAGRIFARIREALEVELPLGAIFEYPTLEALAATVEDALLAEMEPAESSF